MPRAGRGETWPRRSDISLLGRLAALDPPMAVAGDANCCTCRGVAAQGGQPGGGTVFASRRRRVAAVGRAARVRGDVVAAPGSATVDVDTPRAMARPRRTHQEQKDGGNESCSVEPSHVPLAPRGLATKPPRGRASYGDTNAPVKEKGGLVRAFRLGGHGSRRPSPVPVGHAPRGLRPTNARSWIGQ